MATRDYVTQQYRELLGRDPDAGGLAHYLGYSNPNAVRSSILGSAEYKSRSAPAPATNPVIDFAAQQKRESDALLAAQNAKQEGLFSNYKTTLQNQEALPAIYNRLQAEAGIPELSQRSQTYKDQIYATKDKLDRLSEDVIARTTGYNVSDAQRRRLETAEADPLQTNLGRFGTALAPITEALSSAQNNVTTQLGMYASERDRQLRPLEMEINSLSDRFAREISGFNANKETMLTGILDKLQRDRQLSDRDWELAQQLAAEERAYSRQKASAAQALALNNTGAGGNAGGSGSRPSVDVNSYLKSGSLNINPSALFSSGGLTTQLPASSTPRSNAIPLFSTNNNVGDPLGVLSRLR